MMFSLLMEMSALVLPALIAARLFRVSSACIIDGRQWHVGNFEENRKVLAASS
jgi:hypothetical protein